MEQIIPLSPQEFRAIKLDYQAIFCLLRKILIKFGTEQLMAFSDNSCVDSVSIGQYYDENKRELLLFAYSRRENHTEDSIISYIKGLRIVAQDSILTHVDGCRLCSSIQIPSTGRGQTQGKVENAYVESVAFNSFAPWKKREVRFIRLSQDALGELLWEYFMEVGYQLMNLPQEDSCDSPTIYRMYTEDKFQSLTLYVMNLFESSNSVFAKVDAYCDTNIDVLGETAVSNWTDISYYVAEFLSNL